MSKRLTPKTDAAQHEGLLRGNPIPTQVVLAEFARELERENEAMRAAIHEAATALEWLSTAAAGGMQPANGKINAIRNAKTVLAALKPFLPETPTK